LKRLSVLFVTTLVLLGQATDQTREIWDTGYRTQRPHVTNAVPPAPKSMSYRPVPQDSHSIPTIAGATPVIGVTLWCLRRASTADENRPRLLVPDTAGSSPRDYVPERIRLDQPLHVGDRIRLGIESPREGYLYIVDRERYRDGSRGTPYLLFPIESMSLGDNHVSPGRLVELPSQADPIPALKVDRRDQRHVGEELLLIFSATRLPAIEPGPREQALPEDLVAAWEREFTPVNLRLELVGSGGVWTAAERSAGGAQRLLTPEDPMPQSIFVTTGGRERPLMVRVALVVQP
jgi:hypothetical protein